MKIALIDHFDSFTYNLKALCELAYAPKQISVFSPFSSLADIIAFDADLILIGPGPGRPQDYPLSFQIVENYFGKKLILGVCLGLQIVNEFHGGKTLQAPAAYHGKTSSLVFVSDPLWQGINEDIPVMRYHSLYVDVAPGLKVIARSTEDDLPMAITGEKFLGLQFHPESFASRSGLEILRQFYHV